MSEWWTYRPEDFLLFSPRVYWRLFELHNAAWWPLQIVALLAGLLLIVVLLTPRPWLVRCLGVVLAASWGFVAWAFLWQRYAPINWAIEYVIPLFALQALLLLGALSSGWLTFTDRRRLPRYIGLALILHAVILHPLVPLLSGRSWQMAEVFAVAPDPLAIATLGLLVSAHPARWAWPLMVIPLLWCLISWLTLDTMGAPSAWSPLTAACLALVTRLWPHAEAK
ncbi:DUF6064 family protein [Aidingimonas halophila]|uniref:MFS transporter permease n=1 Tax=Aidingimonas halophila TaxID=574349 RepID=A0A1H2UWA6_9GAMM|nr:DUF6064 family protein [Aidingimonas halophila]GHC23295.1 hypothetical protein GCM10008094_12550 [Aidingimonas halophila]SDW60397.1 hypothetical protein SAMN05443545_102258 [Aidingimonas halophila]